MKRDLMVPWIVPHFLSTVCRLAQEERRASDIYGLGGEARAGLETRGQRELSAE